MHLSREMRLGKNLVTRDLVLVHSSDVHIRSTSTSAPIDELKALRQIIEVSEAVGASVLLLAGDVFDDNRLPMELLQKTHDVLAAASLRVVFLPGNHDPVTTDSAYIRGGFTGLDHVYVLGISEPHAVHFPDLELEVWGQPHTHYNDMSPLADPRGRTTKWQVAMAHGHYMEDSEPTPKFGYSWAIRDSAIQATGADYVALGHWNRPTKVGAGIVPAYYSGSPELARSVNVVRFREGTPVQVERCYFNGVASDEEDPPGSAST
jgi:DNA repair exonuclease SbcCD nuclease subunit